MTDWLSQVHRRGWETKSIRMQPKLHVGLAMLLGLPIARFETSLSYVCIVPVDLRLGFCIVRACGGLDGSPCDRSLLRCCLFVVVSLVGC